MKTISGVEIFASGTHNGDVYTDSDLDDIVSAYKDLDYKPAIKVGHSKDEPGAPAYGWVENVRRVGTKLVADFTSMHDSVVDAIRKRSYDRVSSEIYFNFKRGAKTFRRALKAVALLGSEVPAVANLTPLHKVQFEADGFEKVATASELDLATFADDEGDGVWRTVRGRRIFIRKGQSIDEALKADGVDTSTGDDRKDTQTRKGISNYEKMQDYMKNDPRAGAAKAKLGGFAGKTLEEKASRFAGNINTKNRKEVVLAMQALAAAGVDKRSDAVKTLGKAMADHDSKAAKRIGRNRKKTQFTDDPIALVRFYQDLDQVEVQINSLKENLRMKTAAQVKEELARLNSELATLRSAADDEKDHEKIATLSQSIGELNGELRVLSHMETENTALRATIAQLAEKDRNRDVAERLAVLTVPAFKPHFEALLKHAAENPTVKVKVYTTADGKTTDREKTLSEVASDLIGEINAKATKLFSATDDKSGRQTRTDAPAGSDPGVELDKKATEYLNKHPELKGDYAAAFEQVCLADPTLAKAYADSQNPRGN
jgi:hypothetical protein